MKPGRYYIDSNIVIYRVDDVGLLTAEVMAILNDTSNYIYVPSKDEETAAATGSAHVAVKDARASIDKIYARIRNRVNSYVDDETPVPALDAFVAQLNVITKRFNTLAAHHHHKKGGKEGDGGCVGVVGLTTKATDLSLSRFPRTHCYFGGYAVPCSPALPLSQWVGE